VKLFSQVELYWKETLEMNGLFGKSVLSIVVRRGSHWGGSLQNGLGDEQTCGTTLASAYVLRCLSATWSQLQINEGKSE